jgi:hypothetical protein
MSVSTSQTCAPGNLGVRFTPAWGAMTAADLRGPLAAAP